MTTTYELTVQEDPNDPDGALLQFPDSMIETLGWQEGDLLTWETQSDGSVLLSRTQESPTELVLVECISTFRHRYMVEVPVGKKDWALDTVTMDGAKEFSQEHIGEQIVSHRVVTEDEALAICDQDNKYTTSWDVDAKKATYFTSWKEQQP